jgi:hypothetical protein
MTEAEWLAATDPEPMLRRPAVFGATLRERGTPMVGERQCTRCGKALVVHGSFATRGRFGFRPEELRLFSLSLKFPEVSLTTKSAACAACGLVWAELDPAVLRQKLHDLGNGDVKRRLGLLDGEYCNPAQPLLRASRTGRRQFSPETRAHRTVARSKTPAAPTPNCSAI